MPDDEFLKIQEALEDADDLSELNKAHEASKNEIPIPLDEVLKRYRPK